MSYVLRPMPTWPHEASNPRRDGQFRVNGRWVDGEWQPGKGRVPWDETLRLLESEVWALGSGNGPAAEILIGVGLSEYDVRQDGTPRANARAMAHPGVEISFDSRYGRLTYATDVFNDWRDNVRAVAKGLEALRAVERWGVAKRGQQYAGFALLTAGPGQEDLGRQLVEQYGGVTEALRATHPDTGGAQASPRDFAAVVAFQEGARMSQKRVGYNGRQPRVLDEGAASPAAADGPVEELGRLPTNGLGGPSGGAGPVERRKITDAELAMRVKHAPPGLVLATRKAVAKPMPATPDPEPVPAPEPTVEAGHVMTTEVPTERPESMADSLAILADAVVEAIEAQDELVASEHLLDQARLRWKGARAALDAAYQALDDPPPAIADSERANIPQTIPEPPAVGLTDPAPDAAPLDSHDGASEREPGWDSTLARSRAAALTGAAAAKAEAPAEQPPIALTAALLTRRAKLPMPSYQRRALDAMLAANGDRDAAAAKLKIGRPSVTAVLGVLRKRTDLTPQEWALVAPKRP